MITILGYVFLYLIVGVVLLPFFMLEDKLDVPEAGSEPSRSFIFGAMCTWPITIILVTLSLWAIG